MIPWWAKLASTQKWPPASSALASLVPVSTLPTTVAVRKGYCDGTNRHRYYMLTPISVDGITAQIWDMTTEGSPSPYTTGMIRLVRSQVVYLWANTRYTLAYNAGARSGVWANLAAGTTTGWAAGIVYTIGASSEAVTYTVVVPEGGGIGWQWFGISNSGIAWVVIKNNGGTEIAAGYYDVADDGGGHRAIDTYVAQGPRSPTLISTRLAHGLPAGTYTVAITASGTKNGSSSGYRLYEVGVDALDLSTAGNYATAPWFYEGSIAPLIGSATINSGNNELAAFVRQAGHDPAESAYCGGTHGNESAAASVSILVDGVDRAATLKATGTAWGTGFSGTTIVMSHTTTGITQTGSVNWATFAHQHAWTRAGMAYTLTRTILADVDAIQEYVGMLIAQNATVSGYPNVRVWARPREKYTDGVSTPGVAVRHNPVQHSGVVFYSDVAAMAIDTPVALARTYPPIANEGSAYLVIFNTDATIKSYCSWDIMLNSSYYRTLVAGDVKTVSTAYRGIYVLGGGVIAAVDGA